MPAFGDGQVIIDVGLVRQPVVTGKRFAQGEITERNLQAGILRRLMYNPNFDLLKVSMKRFIEGLT